MLAWGRCFRAIGVATRHRRGLSGADCQRSAGTPVPCTIGWSSADEVRGDPMLTGRRWADFKQIPARGCFETAGSDQLVPRTVRRPEWPGGYSLEPSIPLTCNTVTAARDWRPAELEGMEVSELILRSSLEWWG